MTFIPALGFPVGTTKNSWNRWRVAWLETPIFFIGEALLPVKDELLGVNPCQQKDDLLADRQDVQRTRDSRRGVERKGTHSSPGSTEITSSILYLSACEFRSSVFWSEQIFAVDELVCSL